jgi:ribosomal protein L18
LICFFNENIFIFNLLVKNTKNTENKKSKMNYCLKNIDYYRIIIKKEDLNLFEQIIKENDDNLMKIISKSSLKFKKTIIRNYYIENIEKVGEKVSEKEKFNENFFKINFSIILNILFSDINILGLEEEEKLINSNEFINWVLFNQ